MSNHVTRWWTLVSNELKQSSLATNFCFGLILLMLEKIVEADFACPCAIGPNMTHTILFFIVPPGIVFFLMFAVKYPCKSCESCQSCVSCETCKPCKFRKSSFGEALIYTIVPALTWLVLLFIDGRYYACLRSNWKGKYEIIENGQPQRWCKPYNSSADSAETFLTDTQFWYSESQLIGFIIAAEAGTIYVFYLCCCRPKSNSPTTSNSEDYNKVRGDEETAGVQMQEKTQASSEEE